jgi:hypothetical protein
MKKMHVAVLAAVVMAAGMGAMAAGQAGATSSEAATTRAGEKTAKMGAWATANQGALVVVEYECQFDKGDAPEAKGLHVETNIEEERPVEVEGVLVDATHVVTRDLEMHPRFIKGIKVRSATGDAKALPRVTAKVSACPKEQEAVILELSEELAGAKPAKFTGGEGPYFTVGLVRREGKWKTIVRPLSSEVEWEDGTGYEARVAMWGLTVDKEGKPVGIATGGELKADGSWKGDPMKWAAYSGAEMKALLGKVESQTEKGIVPVTLNFRAPKSTGSTERYYMREASVTVGHALGVYVDEKTLVVLANMKPATTARLERIKVMSNPPVEAKFIATLKDYGAIVVKTDVGAAGIAGWSKEDILKLKGRTIPTATVTLQGENRVMYFQTGRIEEYNEGFRGNIYPTWMERSFFSSRYSGEV